VLLKKLKIDYKTHNNTWTNPQIKNHKRNHTLSVIRPQTQHKNPEHILKFVTPLTLYMVKM